MCEITTSLIWVSPFNVFDIVFARSGQTGFAGEPDEDPTNAQGKHTLGCPRLGRPARAPPHTMETRDEQHIGLEEKVKI